MLFSASTKPRKYSLGVAQCKSEFSHIGITPPQQTYHPSGPIFSLEISMFANPQKSKKYLFIVVHFSCILVFLFWLALITRLLKAP